MKLPRWLVISMLTSSVLAVLAAAGWWWVTWPGRTTRAYLDCAARDGITGANQFLANGKWEMKGNKVFLSFKQDDKDKEVRLRRGQDWTEKVVIKVQSKPLSTMDYLVGRRRMRVMQVNDTAAVWQEFELHFVVEQVSVHFEKIPIVRP